MRIVLVEPEIPGNTGNIARLAAALGASLHLIKPLGFSLDDRYLKRAGLDYWHLLDVHIHENYDEFLEKFSNGRVPYFLTTKASTSYGSFKYSWDDILVFGKETAGLSKVFMENFIGIHIKIPMIEEARSLNLSNAVAIVSYEIARQNLFRGMKIE